MTIAENEALSESERLEMLKLAKGGSWYSDYWAPYCLNCSTGLRMERQSYGFRCSKCSNRCGWDLQKLDEDDGGRALLIVVPPELRDILDFDQLFAPILLDSPVIILAPHREPTFSLLKSQPQIILNHSPMEAEINYTIAKYEARQKPRKQLSEEEKLMRKRRRQQHTNANKARKRNKKAIKMARR